MISHRSQGYLFVAITMCIWGGFTLTSRLSAQWHISAWDITALRFALAFCILMPILIYKKDTDKLKWKVSKNIEDSWGVSLSSEYIIVNNIGWISMIY